MLDSLFIGATALMGTSATDIQKATGLTGIPGNIRGDVFDRPEADGVVEPANQYLGARIITLEGVVWGASVDAAWTSWNAIEKVLLAAVQTQTLLKWQHASSAVPKQATVRLIDAQGPVLDADHQGPFLEYQITLRADDPTIYAQASQSNTATVSSSSGGMPLPVVFPIPFGTVSSTGTVTITNNGNAPGWPVLTVTGPIAGPVVGNQTTGKYLYFDTLTLAAGDSLTITTVPNQRGASLAGVSKLGNLRFADSAWPSMTPGVAEAWQIYSLGGGTTGATLLTIAWNDAYVS
jgi:hypothetical protein